jgi:hypothetical protein
MGYTGITQFNKWKDAAEDYDNVSAAAYHSKRKVGELEEKLQEQREVVLKLQERLGEAVMAAREAKIVSESNQKELRAGLAAQKVELEVTANSLKSEMNTVKRATTNRLGQ